MRKLLLQLLIITLALTINACASFKPMLASFKPALISKSEAQQLSLGKNVKDTLLEGMSNKVGLADARATLMVLEQLNTTRKWVSVYGAYILIRPSLAQYSAEKKQWCRELMINVDEEKKVVTLCRRDNHKRWYRLPS
jgi:hypothetical protein